MTANRTYYRIELASKSALSIGAADSYGTDSDLVLDSRGLPMLPASSIRGACRSWFARIHGKDEANELFGTLDEGKASHLRFYDAMYLRGNCAVSVRDSVKLKDDEKVAEKGLKFDREIAEPGAVYGAYAEALDADAEGPFEEMLGAIRGGLIRFGSKTSRGFGEMDVRYKKRSFDLSIAEQRTAWLENTMFDEDWWKGEDVKYLVPAAPADGGIVIDLELKVKGAISIREYSTEPKRPDFGQLSVRYAKSGKKADAEGAVAASRVGEGEAPEGPADAFIPKEGDWAGKPVIPGTSWAGAFRSRYREFARAIGEDAHPQGSDLGFVEELFGTVRRDGNGNEVVSGSRISFSESKVDEGEWKEITRNAIDRFTGGTVKGALFTERTHYGGKTTLRIRIEPSDLPEGSLEKHLQLLLFAIADLHFGFMAVGGLTSVGHGLFSVDKGSVRYGGKPVEGLEGCLSDIKDVGKKLGEFASKVLAAEKDDTKEEVAR